ncbi:hypothetical protein BUALT_Bualt17G0022400 [Buddleja alternifolia]|uniref:Bestrophin homolog n=1 Tax=Buddleja alternifolia TaxID=168488 RepID=A0AAV6WBQ5_9LAMI|nr:hypothetical protein BUALT_Bualt17G0022400 [Buddleja alternifolia]
MRVLYFFWSLPINIMISGFSLFNMVSGVTKKSTPRRRPLHTFGASFLAIAHNASTKLQDYDSPLGSIAKRAIKFFNLFFPFIYTMLYQWLAMLSFMDDQILTVENTVETIFPPSKCLFDKIDGLVCNAEVLPEQVDGFMTKFPMVMNWPILHPISWLKFLFFNLTHLRSMTNITREKEIKIDENCNSTQNTKTEQEKVMKSQSDSSLHENDNDAESIKRLFSLKNIIKTVFDEPEYSTAESPVFYSFKSAASSPFSDCSQDGYKNPFGQTDSPTRRTYKEILERGRKTDDENKDDNAPPEALLDEKKLAEIGEKSGKYSENGSLFKDQVAQIFEASWHLM